MGNKRVKYILIAVFLLVLTVRLYFAFQTPYFTDNDSYFTLRQVESIMEHRTPIYDDSLSYGGRQNMFLPLYYYILAFFSIIIPVSIVVKVIPNIFAALAIFVVYYLVKSFTKNEKISILAAAISGFTPIFFYKTINSISIYSIVVPLLLLLIYLFLNIERETNAKYFLILIFIYILLHPSSIIFILSLIVYFILLKTESFSLKRSEIEVVLFSFLVMIWLYLIFFKKLFLEYGFGLIWQNIPLKHLSLYFHQISIWQAIFLIGIIPLVFGLYTVYNYLFSVKDRKVYLLISFAIVITLLMWFKLIQLDMALIFLSIILVVLFAIAYTIFESFVAQTRFKMLKHPLFILLCIILVFTSLIPSLSYASVAVKDVQTEEEINAMQYLRTVEEDAKIVSTVDEGHLITYFAQRKNTADTNYYFIDNINERINDIDMLFTTVSGIKSTEILTKYDIDYIYFSERAKKEYGITALSYIDKECFDTVMNGDIKIYKNKCMVVTER